MHRNKLACSLLVLVVAGSMWACSDDDTDSVGTAGSGGASAGSSGKGGSGGAKAGTGGKAGEDTGGAGEGGAEAVAGAGAGGDSAGGAGGAGGEPSEAGAGGEGGAPPALTLEQACAAVCADQTGLSCTLGASCVENCTTVGTDPLFGTDQPALYEEMMGCLGVSLTATDYYCSQAPGTPMPPPLPAPKDETSCETKICAWTCADMVGAADTNVATRCGCPFLF